MEFQKEKILADIQKAEAALDLAISYLARECEEKGEVSVPKLDRHQVLAYDVAWVKSELVAASQIVEWAENKGELEKGLASIFVGEALVDANSKLTPKAKQIGMGHFFSPEIDLSVYEKVTQLIHDTQSFGNYGLTEDQQMIRETFKKFAEDVVKPLTEKVHRQDLLIPQEIINGLKELGCFGLSIPQRYGGFQDDAKPDHMGMLIVTEELSRASLGIAGSLITRPEILSKAILKGGTEEQKQKWLPLLASGERMAAVAVTEPDFGSDVAGMRVAANPTEGGYLINGVKTWCTFAGYADSLMVLARTNPDLSAGHRGLSILIAEKPRFDGHAFSHTQESGGKIEGRAIATIGYRGMHSYEVAFENYFVPAENLIGGEAGLGKGFYLQMEGFAGGRIQTAARANGVMQAALEAALNYSNDRKVFKQPIINYQLTQYKIAKMAAILQACRQLTYYAAQLMDDGKGQMEASLVKFYASKMAEWVTREALQLHGGMGYAEEFPVSRYFVDARVFSIFEGAEDVLALRVIARTLVDQKMKG
ncbi:MAG: acyl-CoA/acyl-ACP dehydrogenase [Deltaproteobacteria bacterium]|nr:acyl-CoA/acyl-ACP dehydrogenase [Deltaproteobacteria bacterium]